MGYGYKCKCSRRHESSVYFGFGGRYSQTYKMVVQDIKNGKYGEEWKALRIEYPNGAINALRYLYICDECGFWESDYSLDFLLPNNPEEPAVDYYLPSGVYKKKYHIHKQFIHKCKKCGSTMRKEDKLNETLKCPKCGRDMNDKLFFCWD